MAQPPHPPPDASPHDNENPMEEVRQHGASAAAFFLAATAALSLPIYILHHKKTPRHAPPPRETVVGEGVLLGHWGYALYVPAGYTARSEYDPARRREAVSFVKTGTPVENPHLWTRYKALGIITLLVSPSPVPDTLAGLKRLETMLAAKSRGHREVFTMQELNLSPFKAVALSYEPPHRRFEVYAVGEHLLYSFTAGASSTVLTQIVTSLRDTKRED